MDKIKDSWNRNLILSQGFSSRPPIQCVCVYAQAQNLTDLCIRKKLYSMCLCDSARDCTYAGVNEHFICTRMSSLARLVIFSLDSEGQLKDINPKLPSLCNSNLRGVYPNWPIAVQINTDPISSVWENSFYQLPLCCPDNPSLIHAVQSWITMSAPPTISVHYGN